MIRNLAAALALVSLAACGMNGDADDAVPGAEAKLDTDLATSAAEALATPSETPVTVTIPDTIQGRWGLVAADCTATDGSSKGLLTITPTRLEFYESVGRLVEVVELAPNHLQASFAFTGEGLEWQRQQVLDASEDGKTLTRRELGNGAAPGPFSYMRCGEAKPDAKAGATTTGGDEA